MRPTRLQLLARGASVWPPTISWVLAVLCADLDKRHARAGALAQNDLEDAAIGTIFLAGADAGWVVTDAVYDV
jgi:hypothetical protein